MKKVDFRMERIYHKYFTVGEFNVYVNGYFFAKFYSLEPPVESHNGSPVCIPRGVYPVASDDTGKHQLCKILNIPGRNNIELHAGNYVKDTKGCILIGKNYIMNEDSSNVVLNCSLAIVSKLKSFKPFKGNLIINEVYNYSLTPVK